MRRKSLGVWPDEQEEMGGMGKRSLPVIRCG